MTRETDANTGASHTGATGPTDPTSPTGPARTDAGATAATAPTGAADSPVERYLDRLLVAAPGPPRQVRALLSEADAHLRDATDDGLARGLSQQEAETEAVERFGSVQLVAAAEAQRQWLPFGTLVGQIITSGLFLWGIGAVAVGITGVLTRIIQAFGGQSFIVDISNHTYLSPADCTRWLSGDPAAHTCYQAALSDWAGDIVAFRIAAGVIGLLALAAYAVLRRRRPHWGVLPASVTDTIAVVGFGAAGAWSLGLGVDWVIQSHNGAGQWLASAPVALALALYYGLRLANDVRRPPQWPSPVEGGPFGAGCCLRPGPAPAGGPAPHSLTRPGGAAPAQPRPAYPPPNPVGNPAPWSISARNFINLAGRLNASAPTSRPPDP